MTTGQRLGATLLIASLAFAGCADETDDAATNDPSTTTTAGATEDTTEDTSDDAAEDTGTLEVQLVDYRFEGLPERIAAGTKLRIRNASAKEVHELVAFRLPDSETRSIEELLALPEAESAALFAGEPAAVLIARPGGEQVSAVGDGTLTEPGRYLVMCAIQTGADPDEYFAALESATEPGPVMLEGAGPPHFMAGMVQDLYVD